MNGAHVERGSEEVKKQVHVLIFCRQAFVLRAVQPDCSF